MTSSSSAKKVRKAAKAGGNAGPKRSSDRSLGYPLAIAAICVLGLALVVSSKLDNSSDATEPPEVDETEFAATYGIYDCTGYLPTSLAASAASADPFTIPLASAEAERNGRLDRWGQEVGLELSTETLVVSGVDPEITRAAGDDCEGEEGSIFLTVWSVNDDAGAALDEPEVQTITEEIEAYRPRNGDQIAIVFAPAGSEIEPLPAIDATEPPGTDTAGLDTQSGETDGSDTQSGETGGSDPSGTDSADTSGADTG